MTDNWVALVPIRAGSKGFPGKNTADLAGKPLYQHAVDQGLAAGAEACYISTDITQVLAKIHGPKVTAFARPAELARDGTPMDAVLRHFVDHIYDGDGLVVLLQATSPLRQAKHIVSAVEKYRSGGFDLVMSVTPTPSGILKYGTADGDRYIPVSKPEYCFTNRQDLPKTYRPNGAVYVFSATWFRQNRRLATDNIGMLEMDEDSSLDIDSAADFDRAEALLKSGL